MFPLSAFAGALDAGTGIVSIVLFWILIIVPGVALLSVREDLYRFLRAFAILSMVACSCVASKVLIPIGIPLNILKSRAR